LFRANLSGADLREVNLSGANYDDQAKWPDNFNPKETGMILVDHFGDPIEEEE
jgi:uncharacterized protein YjbI with pentapeptide repeats